MYGAAAVQWGEGPDGDIVTRQIRQHDGYFGVPPDWQNRHVSGVLLVNQLMPYHFQRADVTLWRHPKPAYKLSDDVGLPAHVLAFDRNELKETAPQQRPEHFFGLADPWPPGKAFPDEA